MKRTISMRKNVYALGTLISTVIDNITNLCVRKFYNRV